MSVSHAAVTAAVTATLLSPVVSVRDTRNRNKQTLKIQNISDADVFIGGAGVTTSAYGIKLGTGLSTEVTLAVNDALYCISAAGGKVLKVLVVR